MKEKVVQLMDAVMALGNTNYSRVAAMIEKNGKPLTRQSFFKMVKNGSLRLSVFLEVLDVLGMEMVIRKRGEK